VEEPPSSICYSVDMAAGHHESSDNLNKESHQLTPGMSPYTPPQTPSPRSRRCIIVRIALVLILTAVIATSSILLVGPQVIVIVPVAIGVGIVFALRRSFWSLVCFG